MRLSIALAVAFASGAIALSYEILWYRAFSFLTWTSPTTFGMLLAFYLGGLANGALRSRDLCRAGVGTGDPSQLRQVARYLLLASCAAFLVVPLLAWSATIAGAWGGAWICGYGLVAVAATLLGAVLPLCSHFGIAPDERAGARLSYVYLANIIGSALGSFLTGFVLLDRWPLRTVATALMLLGLALSATVLAAARASPRELLTSGGAAVGLAVATALVGPRIHEQLWERLLYKENFTPATRLEEAFENRSGVIAVTRDQRVFGGGAYDGVFNTSLTDDRNYVVRAHAVGAMHPSPREVLMIGLGSGSWAQVVAHTPGVARLVAVEINPGYLDLIARHAEVASLLRNPRVDLLVDDGRRWLAKNPDRRFDFIVANTSYHWRAHATNLLSREFLELARAHLLPGGVLYYNTTGSRDVLATAVAVFPYALRLWNFVALSDAPIRFDPERWRRMLTEVVVDGRPPLDPAREPDRTILADLLAVPGSIVRSGDDDALQEGAPLRALAAQGEVITDDNMRAEWRHPFTFRGGIAPDKAR